MPPLKSTAQRAYLAIHNPKVAHEFAQATPPGTKLPKHVGKGVFARILGKDK